MTRPNIQKSQPLRAVPKKRENVGRIATINCRGLANDIKLGSTINAFELLRLDVLSLTEVRRRGKEILHDVGDLGSTLVYNGYKMKSDAGVGFLFSSRVRIDDLVFESPRILKALITLGGLKMALICVYCPPNTDTHKESFKDKHYQLMQKSLNAVPKQYKVCVLGDANASIAPEAHNIT